MTVLFFATRKNGDVKRLQREVAAVTCSEKLEAYTTFDSLVQRLRKPICHSVVAVLFITGEEELLKILSISDLLLTVRIILVLQDREKETITKGHRVYPRFLSHADSDFKDVAAVLEKMLETRHSY
jgi:hypothetical protein